MTALALYPTLQTVTDFLGNSSAIQLSTLRLGIRSDSSVTTQTSSVIQATTTNANLVIAPNGAGALVARIPDGTAVGGNARGNNSVDLQIYQSTTGVASGDISVCGGGRANTASNNYSVVSGGYSNISSGQFSYVGAGTSNTASSNYSTVSGGQSNVASTNTHATVVGGQGNTSSGLYSISGGTTNTASGSRSISLGDSNTASGYGAVCIGLLNTGTGQYSFSIGFSSASYLESQFSLASNKFSSNGDAQQSLLTARNSSALTTGATLALSLDGTGTSKLIIPNGNNRMWNVQVRWVAVVTAITGTATGVTVGDTKTSTDLLAVAKRSGTTTVSAHTSAGTHAIETTAGSLTAVNIAYTAGASQEMAITFTGPTFVGGGSVTMRVVAAISLTEVAY
jgi:hypothetical protein